MNTVSTMCFIMVLLHATASLYSSDRTESRMHMYIAPIWLFLMGVASKIYI